MSNKLFESDYIDEDFKKLIDDYTKSQIGLAERVRAELEEERIAEEKAEKERLEKLHESSEFDDLDLTDFDIDTLKWRD